MHACRAPSGDVPVIHTFVSRSPNPPRRHRRFRPFLWLAWLAVLVFVLGSIEFQVINVTGSGVLPEDPELAQATAVPRMILRAAAIAVLLVSLWLDRRTTRDRA